MKTEYSGRQITVTKPAQKYGPCTFTIGDSEEMTVYPGMVDRPSEPTVVLAWIRRFIDKYDSEPVNALHAAWWYRPGTVETCPASVGKISAEHIKPVGEPCPEMYCAKKARIEAARAKGRTGLTAAAISSVLVRGGFARADLNWDSTAKTEGFDTTGEQRNRRVAILWRDGIHGPGELRGELPKIGAFLKDKGYPVRIAEPGAYLWVYPKGTEEPTEGSPLPTS